MDLGYSRLHLCVDLITCLICRFSLYLEIFDEGCDDEICVELGVLVGVRSDWVFFTRSGFASADLESLRAIWR
jgi:hypothetical protein